MKKINPIYVAMSFFGLGVAIFIVILLWIMTDPNYFHWFVKIDSKTAYELGGFITGLVGIFWSAAGVILIYATFTKQKELNEKQQFLNEKQQFETTFFSLLDNYHNLINNTCDKVDQPLDKKSYSSIRYKGRAYFSAVLSEFKSGLSFESFRKSLCTNRNIPEINKFLDDLGKTDDNMNSLPKPEWEMDMKYIDYMRDDISKQFVIFQYEFIYDKHPKQLGHIFRFLYNIFKFTIEERAKYKDEDRYINLIQAQLSSDELGLLFYNALSGNAKTIKGEYKFFDWLDHYKFFQNIDSSSLLYETHCAYYPKTKFKMQG